MIWSDIVAIVVPIVVVIIQIIASKILSRDSTPKLAPYIEQSKKLVEHINRTFDLLVSNKSSYMASENREEMLLSYHCAIEQFSINKAMKSYIYQLFVCFLNVEVKDSQALVAEIDKTKTKLIDIELVKQTKYAQGIRVKSTQFDPKARTEIFYSCRALAIIMIPVILATLIVSVITTFFQFSENVAKTLLIFVYTSLGTSALLAMLSFAHGMCVIYKQGIALRMQREWHKLVYNKDDRKKYNARLFEIFDYEIKEPESVYKLFVKRILDFVCSLLGLIILMPFFLIFTPIVAIAMRGNPFFTQERPGKKGKIFTMIKYRTMNNKKDKDGNLLPDQDRLTKFGSIMRALSIDELPELINIFCGKMSIVGPRPLRVEYLEKYNDFQKRRHEVRPGLTGLAQVEGRNNTTWQARFEKDVEYVDKCSFGLDVKIFFKTFLKVFKREGIAQEGNATMEFFHGNDEIVLTDKQVDCDDSIANDEQISNDNIVLDIGTTQDDAYNDVEEIGLNARDSEDIDDANNM